MIVPRSELRIDSVAAHYDELDRFYREIWGEHVHHGYWRTGQETAEEAVTELVALVAGRAGIAPGDSVCDVGSGYGGTARILAREYGARVTALTVSRVQHEYARALAASTANPTYLLRDWRENRLPSSSFDALMAVESTEHMADKSGFFEEAWRVLKPGGRLVVCAWLAKPDSRRWEVRHLLEPICREGRLAGMGTPGEYEALARCAGLTAVSIEDLSQRVRRTWAICAGRAIHGLIREREYRRFLFAGRSAERIFALTLLRIWLAYHTGSMRYGLLTALKPEAKKGGTHDADHRSALRAGSELFTEAART